MIAIDVDSVVAEIMPVIMEMQNEKHGTSYRKEDVTKWHQEFEEFALVDAVHELFNSSEAMKRIRPVEGAIKGIAELDRMNIEFVFVTNRNVKYATQTSDWIHEYFGPRPIMHVKGCKKLPFITALMDDSPSNILSFKEAGGYPIIFDQPWNRELDGDRLDIRRAMDWEDALEKLSTYDLWLA